MFEKISRHAGLMDAMARGAGADLGMAIADGRLPPAALRSAVQTCTQCRNVGDCEAYLAEGAGVRREVPDYCLNKHLLDRLRV